MPDSQCLTQNITTSTQANRPARNARPIAGFHSCGRKFALQRGLPPAYWGHSGCTRNAAEERQERQYSRVHKLGRAQDCNANTQTMSRSILMPLTGKDTPSNCSSATAPMNLEQCESARDETTPPNNLHGGERKRRAPEMYFLTRTVVPCKKPTPSVTLALLHLLLLLPVGSCTDFTQDQLSRFRRERTEAAKTWAPLVFLHPDERFFPSAVHSFIKNVIPREVLPSEHPTEPPILVSMSRSLKAHPLPEGDESEHTFLFAPIDASCKNCPLPDLLYGTKPSPDYSPPVYATISSCLPRGPGTFKKSPKAKGPSWQSLGHRRLRFRKRRARFGLRGRRKVSTAEATPRLDTLPSRRETHNFIGDHTPEFSLESDPTPPQHLLYTSPSSTLVPPPGTHSFPGSPNQWGFVEAGSTSPLVTDNLDSVSIETGFFGNDFFATTVPDFAQAQTDYIDEDSSSMTPSRNTVSTSYERPSNAILGDETGENPGRGHSFTITYWMFYPFSQGKQVCTSHLWLLGRVFKPRLRNRCYGDPITLNSHVGDWEHVSIYFEDGIPQLMYVSTHVYGAFYRYNQIENVFVYQGKDTRMGLALNPKYPPVIEMDGTHAVLYSALGSHGLWGSPGVHRYESFLPLEDKTGAGTPWRTAQNIDIIDYRDPDYDRPDRQWLHFHGRWGNPASGCHKGLFGSCDLANGPTGIPLKRENFPCHLPHHQTFFPKD